MQDFFEKAYFTELERKTKLHTALAFPLSAMVIGFSLLGISVDTKNLTWYEIIPLCFCAISLLVYLWSNFRFLIGREYHYLCTLDELIEHRNDLENFSIKYPDAPTAETTFKKHLEADLAKCASANARTNDARSQNLYNANASALTFVCFALVLGVISKVT